MRPLGLIVIWGVAASLYAALPQEELRATLEAANEAFLFAESSVASDPTASQRAYRRAALRYERLIVDGEISNAALHYNLANSLLGAGDYGRAILNYRRALSADPDNDAALRNLSIARERRAKEFAAAVEFREDALSTWLAMTSYQAAAFLVLWVVSWGLLAYRRLRPGKLGRDAVAATWVTTVGVLALAAASANCFGYRHGVVTASQTVARQGDGPSYPPALPQPLKSGAEFRIIQTVGDWSRATLGSGEPVWISTRDFDIVEDSPAL